MPESIIAGHLKASLDAGFSAQFNCLPERYFSAPGRTEIGGNHTDHQRGRVLRKGACHILSICPQGGTELTPKPPALLSEKSNKKCPL